MYLFSITTFERATLRQLCDNRMLLQSAGKNNSSLEFYSQQKSHSKMKRK